MGRPTPTFALLLITTLVVSCRGEDMMSPGHQSATRTLNLEKTAGSQTRFVSVSAGSSHTCALTSQGAAFCWGHSISNGQYGPSLVPAAVRGGHRFASVTTGTAHSCAVTHNGETYCWGWNEFGQLGTGSSVSMTIEPILVADDLRFGSVTGSYGHTCGATLSGAGYCWGLNHSGQLGDGTTIQRWIPTPINGNLRFRLVSAGDNGIHTCGLTQDGKSYCWGLNGNGILGNEDAAINSTHTTPIPAAGSLRFISLEAGGNHNCGLTSGRAAYCWGHNSGGQLGNGTSGWATSGPTPVRVSGGLKFNEISAGSGHTCGVTVNHKAYCWGSNSYGELGIGAPDSDTHPEPLPLSGELEFRKISAGSGHTCGVTTDQRIYCWGRNYIGQLGNGTTVDSPIPIPVAEPS